MIGSGPVLLLLVIRPVGSLRRTRASCMMIVLPLRGAKPYLFWGDEELVNGQGSGRDGEGWLIRVTGIVERTEPVDIALGNTRIPKLYKVKIFQRHGLKIREIPLDLQMFFEVQVIGNLPNMDGSIEVSI